MYYLCTCKNKDTHLRTLLTIKQRNTMRIIEKEIISAIRRKTNAFAMSNTTIVYNPHTSTHDVLLHGHTIARISHIERWVSLSSCGYLTNTTKSRLNCVLNGLGSSKSVYQKNHQWYIGNAFGTEKFTDGMRVKF